LVDKIFIGKKLVVASATNKSYLSTSGTVVDETKNTIVIKTDKGEKSILKQGTVFSIDDKIIPGDKIIKRLEERIKTRRIKT
jgi:ribonuclease P protein subunit POP4